MLTVEFVEALTASIQEQQDFFGAPCTKMDPETFFTGDGEAAAKAACNNCPYVIECLKQNIWEPYGVWGATTPEERKVLRKKAA